MNATARTEKFLKLITEHLSSRKECRKVAYTCVIYASTQNILKSDVYDMYVSKSGYCIMFHPNVKVYPNIHLRRDANRSTILEHIVRYHLPELLDCDKTCTDLLVPGVYQYQISVSGKRRKWVRVF